MPATQRALHDVLHDEEDDVVHEVFPRHEHGRPAALRGPGHRLQPGGQEAREGAHGQQGGRGNQPSVFQGNWCFLETIFVSELEAQISRILIFLAPLASLAIFSP